MAALPSDRPARRPGRADGSMSLLVDITNDSLDAAYADQAARAASATTAHPAPARTPRRRATGVVLLVLLGLVTGTAVATVRDRAAASTGVRAGLVDKVRAVTAESDALVARADGLRAELAVTRETALGADLRGRAAAERIAAVALAAAAVPVTGPGIVVTVDDAQSEANAGELLPEDLRGGRPEERRITDRELQAIVNALWAVGAEAVSVNDIRLSALTAIRSAGEAILVDFRPLSPPYVVRAVGDPKQLEVDFLDGEIGLRFTSLADDQGFGFDVQREDELRLPSSGEPDLRFAVPALAPGNGS